MDSAMSGHGKSARNHAEFKLVKRRRIGSRHETPEAIS